MNKDSLASLTGVLSLKHKLNQNAPKTAQADLNDGIGAEDDGALAERATLTQYSVLILCQKLLFCVMMWMIL